MVGLTSAAGVVGFLSEPDAELQIFALRKLNEEIDSLWTEVVGSVGEVEALYEDPNFPERELAALVAAKVYYNLQEYNESMVFALGAGKLFDLDHEGEFEDTIISKCVDTYIALSDTSLSNDSNQPPAQLNTAFPSTTNGASSTSASLASPTMPFSQATLPSKSLLSRQDSTNTFDPAGASAPTTALPPSLAHQRGIQRPLQAVIDQLFERCFQEKRYRQVVGIAVEARKFDVIRRAILRASDDEKGNKPAKDGMGQAEELLEYLLGICMDVVQERGLRQELLRLILGLLRDVPSPDVFSIAKCIVYLNEHSMASKLLADLVETGGPRRLAEAYQIAFDLYDNSSQEFLKKVREGLPKVPEPTATQPTDGADRMDEDKADDAQETDKLLSKSDGNDAAAPSSSLNTSVEKPQPMSPEAEKAFDSIREILSGTKTIQLNLEFLYRNNHADVAILNKLKDSLEARNSIFHTAVTLSCGFMNAGTMNANFFRDNLDWLGKAVNWSKFTATAALGVIHRGDLGNGQTLLKPYLPKDTVEGANTGSVYSQGGSLYAMGLIYANHETFALELIRDHFKNATEEVVQHGGALGLGVAGMATGDEGIYDDLKGVLYTDSALNGEAVGIAMGLIMLGTGNIKALEDMIQYAHDTQHEKIVRGLGLGMALIMYGRQEGADELVNGLLDDPDPILRYGGIQTLALAYCGTGSNKAVRKLLHVAVSDVSDDVRRYAVMSLGFILFRKPKSVPRMVELLSESYNPHVRYGAAMALGISCAGTGLDEAIDLLEPMIKDPTDFVRQGALISLSMIMVQQNEAMNPKVGTIRKTLQKAIGDRHEDAMTKFGSAISLGIIDAGGRNCTISLQTQTGNLNMAGIVGMAVFTQYWYWFPLTHFLSLSFTPTAVIGLDQDLEVPSFKFHSATRPSLFDYPPEQEAKTEDAPEKVKTAVLSTTAQAKRRAQKKEKQQRRESMDIDQTPTAPKADAGDKMDTDEPAVKNEGDGEKKDEEEAKEADKPEGLKKKMEKEKVGYGLENMSRVLPAQLKFVSFPDERYEPVKKPTGGVILLNDTKPSEPKTLLEMKKAKKPAQPAATPAALQDRVDAAMAQGEAIREASGAAEAAGVLTAIDEGGEGEEDAEVPHEFEYHSDNE
ncbi:proteasome regulatory particle base subunit [Imshaugia aleurites]|uniref:26S proteasome regulatory subunit RPN2 n=1 Tax=Imshaugia aleurites TaxID=172621 RepID=A0A8H3FPP0_9LECA|nr:proteasome regulatory particle base subunit [Imshaugia aleurites]